MYESCSCLTLYPRSIQLFAFVEMWDRFVFFVEVTGMVSSDILTCHYFEERNVGVTSFLRNGIICSTMDASGVNAF